MTGFFTAIWNYIVSAVKLLLPLGKHAASAVRSPAARWGLHLLAVAVVLALLYLLNKALNIRREIPGHIEFIKDWWLPILFLLVYALAWLGWWLWKLLTAEEEASNYPDIDEAWDAAVAALAQKGIQVADLPLFLVLGRPEGPDGLEGAEKARKAEEALFHEAAQLPLAVKQAPADPQAPLHVYASRDAIYVTCAGASLLGRQAAVLAGEVETAAAAAPEDDATKTLQPDSAGTPAPVRAIAGIVREISRRGGTATDEEQRMLRRLERRGRPQVSFLKDLATVTELTGRLRHLCRLVVRDRQPLCPVNGMMVLIPLAATDSDEDAQNTAESCARDLQAARSVLKVGCPQFVMVCDMEMLPGFREFVGRQKPKDLLNRIGQRFPMGTDLRGDPLAEALEGVVSWLCLNRLPNWVYRLFRVEAAGREEAAAAVSANSRLYLMLSELREREARLARVLTRGVLAGWDGAPRFGGCYLAATGPDAAQQAFVHGVFRRLTDEQDYVAWTDQARADDARYQRLANLGYGILAGIGVLVVAGVAWSILNAGPGAGGPQ